MNDFEDEIIDLEEEIPDKEENDEKIEKQIELPPIFNTYNIKNQSNIQFPNKKNLFKNNINEDLTSKKLQGLGNKNRTIPLNNFNNQSETVEKQNNVNTNSIISTIVAGKKTKEQVKLLSLFSKTGTLKYKIIAISVIIIVIFLFILVLAIASQSETETLGENTHTYVTGEMTDEELTDQLIYYDYCNDENSCKEKGVYSFFTKLKELYDEYSEACGSNIKNNEPCGVTLNTALIIETINYYQNSEEEFFNYDDNDSSELEKEEGFSLFNFFSELFQKYREQKEIEDMLGNIEKLALAQTEYVEETCKRNGSNVTLKYYQINFDKYISYLKYGDTSSHPNYSGNPFKKDNKDKTCEYAKNDYISTSFTTYKEINTQKGEQIVKYALKFVGNPYVWGGTSLTEGVDCSGFTMKVMEHFGIKIPRTSKEQLEAGPNIGTDISKALPGDIIAYEGHVAIYTGNNSIVHASSAKPYPIGGIKISNKADYRKILGIIRVWE